MTTDQRRQFLAALTLAAIYKAPTLSFWLLVGTGWKIVLATLNLGRKVSDEVYAKRNGKCETCLIYFSPLATCGSPLVDLDAGCFCFGPKKNRLAKADCWAKENNISGIAGWPDELRPHQ